TLGNRARHNGHTGCNKHDLKEKVRRTGVDGITVKAVLGGSFQYRIYVQTGDGIYSGYKPATAVHDVVAKKHVHGGGDCKKGDVFGEDFGGVFGANQTGFKHGEA